MDSDTQNEDKSFIELVCTTAKINAAKRKNPPKYSLFFLDVSEDTTIQFRISNNQAQKQGGKAMKSKAQEKAEKKYMKNVKHAYIHLDLYEALAETGNIIQASQKLGEKMKLERILK